MMPSRRKLEVLEDMPAVDMTMAEGQDTIGDLEVDDDDYIRSMQSEGSTPARYADRPPHPPMARQRTAYRMNAFEKTVMVMMKCVIMPIDSTAVIETQKKNTFIAGATSAKTLLIHWELSINHRILL
jgi:hypothetical protein